MSLNKIAIAALGMTILGSSAQAAPIIVDKYYEDNVALSCDTDPCSAFFSPVPAGKKLLVTNIACSITANSSSLYMAEFTSGAGHTIRREILQVGPVRPLGPNSAYTAGGEIKFLLGPGHLPRVTAYLTSTASAHLVGRIVGTRLFQALPPWTVKDICLSRTRGHWRARYGRTSVFSRT